MSMKVIAVIEPFVFQQKIYVFRNNLLMMEVSVALVDLPDRIIQVCHQDDITDVSLKGTFEYAAKIKEEINSREVLLYGHNTLDVKILP